MKTLTEEQLNVTRLLFLCCTMATESSVLSKYNAVDRHLIFSFRLLNGCRKKHPDSWEPEMKKKYYEYLVDYLIGMKLLIRSNENVNFIEERSFYLEFLATLDDDSSDVDYQIMLRYKEPNSVTAYALAITYMYLNKYSEAIEWLKIAYKHFKDGKTYKEMPYLKSNICEALAYSFGKTNDYNQYCIYHSEASKELDTVSLVVMPIIFQELEANYSQIQGAFESDLRLAAKQGNIVADIILIDSLDAQLSAG